MIFDFLLYIINEFLIILKKIDSKNTSRRAINIISWIVTNMVLLIFGICYMFFLSKHLVSYNKLLTFSTVALCFILINVIFSKRYKRGKYEMVILRLEKKHKFSKTKVCILFCTFLIIPLLLFGVGLAMLKKILY